MRIGVLPTEDALPLWAAEQRGLFDKVGLPVLIVPFATEQERDAAFEAGTIDAFVGDVMAVGRLSSRGYGNRIVTVCLGATPLQGRMGIVASARSGIRAWWQLADVPIATADGTMDEYVLDRLLGRNLRTWAIKTTEVPDAAARLAMLTTGTLQAAVLPEPYLSLAILRHDRLILSSTTQRDVVRQTVLSVSDRFLATDGGVSAVNRLLGVWDAGSSLVNVHRPQFRALLVQQAGMPLGLSKHYRMNTYPHHQLPAETDVQRVLTWMVGKDLMAAAPSYADITWVPDAGIVPYADANWGASGSAEATAGTASTAAAPVPAGTP